jgi:ATP-dependent Zn protease
MSDELLNILSNSNKDIDNQKLMDYLSNKLSAEEKHEFEKILVDSDLASDAIDGLNEFKNKKDPVAFAEQLNRNLQKQLEKKKGMRGKRRFKDISWLYFTILLIIIIILIAFFVVFKFLR